LLLNLFKGDYRNITGERGVVMIIFPADYFRKLINIIRFVRMRVRIYTLSLHL